MTKSKDTPEFDPFSITQAPASLPQPTSGEAEGRNRLGQRVQTQEQADAEAADKK